MRRCLGLVGLLILVGFIRVANIESVMGGIFADPVKSYGALFGPNSSFGGETGVQWLIKYPYSLPMIANFFFLSFCAACVFFGLEEVGSLIWLPG